MSAVPPAALPNPAAAGRAMPTGLVVLMLSLLLGIQPVTTDLYLPALPALTEGFGAPVAQAQLTLTALLLAFGSSQLAWGPLSDRFGRRPVLLWGLALYTMASVGSALAAGMGELVAWRTLQGAAMGAAVMGARAVVRDLYTHEAGARAMSRGLTGLGMIACCSVPLGSLLTDAFGWRAALAAPALFGALSLALVALRFGETSPRRNPQALQPAVLLATWRAILRHPRFLAYSALSTASYAGLFTYLASSSFVFLQVLGLSRTEYGLVMFSTSFVYILGTFMCRRLLARFGVRRAVAIAGGITLASGGAMAFMGLAGVASTAGLVVALSLFLLAHGVHQPCSQSGAVGPFPHAAGAASALNGFLMMLVAFGVGGWVGLRLDGTVRALTDGMGFWSLCIALVAWTLVRKHGESDRN